MAASEYHTTHDVCISYRTTRGPTYTYFVQRGYETLNNQYSTTDKPLVSMNNSSSTEQIQTTANSSSAAAARQHSHRTATTSFRQIEHTHDARHSDTGLYASCVRQSVFLSADTTPRSPAGLTICLRCAVPRSTAED